MLVRRAEGVGEEGEGEEVAVVQGIAGVDR
jgi:hypothetical protein